MLYKTVIGFAVLVAWVVSVSAQSDRDVNLRSYPLCFELFPDEVTVEHKTCIELSARYPSAFRIDREYVATTVRRYVDERQRATQADEQLRGQRNQASSPGYAGLEFKGIALGSNISLIENTGRFSCHDEASPIADRTCNLKLDEKETIAGEPVRVLLLYYYFSKLETISIIFDEKHFSVVVAALSDKYGQGNLKLETLTNRMGAKFENRILTWRRSEATLEAKRYSGKVDTSSVIYRSDYALQEFARRRKTSIKDSSKDL